MPHNVSDQDVENYRALGYVVFRNIVPPALVRDLRREAEKAREFARANDANAQRLQPVEQYPQINATLFKEFAELPDLVDAIRHLVAPEAWIPGPSRMGILFEPGQRPWATAWHRDFGPYQQRVDADVYRSLREHPMYFHQINCALYAEGCTWYVPGSHRRDDTPEETHLARDFPWRIGLDQSDQSVEAVEQFCAAYVRSMPGAVQLYLDAGDLALYRNHGYHLGNYVPSQRRATLHDNVLTPPFKASLDRWSTGGAFTETTDDMLAAGAAQQ